MKDRQSMGMGLILWVAVVALTLYGADECWSTAQALRAEVTQEQARLAQEAQRWKLQALRESGQLWVLRARLRGYSDAQRRGLEELVAQQRHTQQLQQGQRALSAEARNHELQSQAILATPGQMQDCFAALGTLRQPATEVLGDVLRGELRGQIVRCDQQLQELLGQMQRATALLQRLPSDIEGRVGDAQELWQSLHGQTQAQIGQMLRLEAAERDLALAEQALQQQEGQSARQLAQWERAQREAAQQTWWRLLLSRGAQAWLWWLHLGTTALGLLLTLLLSLRLAHLWGLGGSLRLRDRRTP